MEHFVVVEPGLEVFAVGEKVEELERGLPRLGDSRPEGVIEELLQEDVIARAASGYCQMLCSEIKERLSVG
jgi:hypothetical protein